MEPIKKIQGSMAPLPINDIDTDQIIPARYLKVTDKNGLGAACFTDWRYNADGSPRPEFPLNRPEYQGAKVLIGVATGKTHHDKRQDIKKREADRDIRRAMSKRV